jgi:hypothetical protein
MPWTDWLGQEEIGRLHGRYPKLSFDEMAVEAIRRPDFAARFAELDAVVEEYSPPNPDVYSHLFKEGLAEAAERFDLLARDVRLRRVVDEG